MVSETGTKFKDPTVIEAAQEEAPWAFNDDQFIDANKTKQMTAATMNMSEDGNLSS